MKIPDGLDGFMTFPAAGIVLGNDALVCNKEYGREEGSFRRFAFSLSQFYPKDRVSSQRTLNPLRAKHVSQIDA